MNGDTNTRGAMTEMFARALEQTPVGENPAQATVNAIAETSFPVGAKPAEVEGI